MIDIPTSVSEAEAVALSQLAAGKRVLEVGSLLGYSTITMALVADQVVSLDPHTGYPADNPRDTWIEFNGNLQAYGVDDRVVAYRDTDEFLVIDQYEPPWCSPFDFAFIDTDGTYETTIRVMERVARWLAVDAPIMAVHDYGLMKWPGAGEAVRDYCTQRQLNFGVIDTLALVRIGHPDD